LTPESAVPLAQPYDLILDCTDRPTTRYLASDTAVVLQKPLITAAALRAEGQLMVLNHPALPQGDSAGAPCYRCVFPRAPAPESLLSCGDAGVLGPVVGVMGVLMAVEAIRLLAVRPRKQEEEQHHSPPSLHLFTPLTHTPFRTIRLRPRRRPSCPACSPSATITASSLLAGTYSYTAFCGLPSTTTLLAPSERVSALEYSSHQKQEQHVLIDTREPAHFDVHSLPGSINVPISLFRSGRDAFPVLPPAPAPIYVICQRGNDSQVAVRALKAAGLDDGGRRFIGDIRGGLRAWREEVDAGWPDF
jgi:adenylyltransferase/sulfurtransferase